MLSVSSSIIFTHSISWRYVFRTDVLNIIYVYWFRLKTWSVNFLILTWIQQDNVIHIPFSLCDLPLMLLSIYLSINISTVLEICK
jgi:hypothetical protein